MEQTVIAEWGELQYVASVNAYGVATIAAHTQPERVEDAEIDRFHDDGGAVSV